MEAQVKNKTIELKIRRIEQLLKEHNIKCLNYRYTTEYWIDTIDNYNLKIEEEISIGNGELRIYKKFDDSFIESKIIKTFPIQTPNLGDWIIYRHRTDLTHTNNKREFFERLEIKLNFEPIFKDYKWINSSQQDFEFEDENPKVRKEIEKFLRLLKNEISDLIKVEV